MKFNDEFDKKYGYNGNKLLKYLRENRIQCEMSDNKNIVLIPTPFNKKEDFDILYNVLLNCDVEMIKSKEQNFYNIDIPKRKFMPYEIIGKESEEVCLSDSLGRVVFENIIPYPPGVPILVSGEIIEQEHIKYIENYINEGTNIIGVNNHYIKVIKSDDKV